MSEGAPAAPAEGNPTPEGEGQPVPAAPAAPAPSPSWTSALGDLQHPSFERFANDDLVLTPKGLVRSYAEAQDYIASSGKIPAPQDGWTEDDWQAHYERLGRPKLAEGQSPIEAYELERPETLPEGIPIDEGVERALVEKLHQHGLTKQQAQGLYRDYMELIGTAWGGQQQQAAQQREQNIQSLREEWADDFDGHVDVANRALMALAGDEAVDEIRTLELGDGTELGNHPGFIRLMRKAGELLAEHGVVNAEGPSGFGQSPEEAMRQYRALEKEVYSMDRLDPEYQSKVERMHALAKRAGSLLTSDGR